MKSNNSEPIKIAILDLYNGEPNEGMRGLREVISYMNSIHEIAIEWKEFDVRISKELPSTDFDIYISSGGPGNPITDGYSRWEATYFKWLDSIMSWNENKENHKKKYVFFICHSFQMASQYFNIGNVTKRKSTALGIFPIHMLAGAEQEPIFQGLNDPFYGVDSREYQVIEPNQKTIEAIGATLLCIEKERPHVALERAIMAIRFNPYMVGTQFHPEADAKGMTSYLQREEKKKTVIENHGIEKWESMMNQLDDPDKILMTNRYVLPNFINQSIKALTDSH